MDKISYAIGLSMGQNLRSSGVTRLEYADLAKGIQDVLEGQKPQITYQEAQTILGQFFSELESRIAGEQKKAGEDFLAANAKRAEAQVLHEIEVILRYVYRAEDVNFSPMFFTSNSKEPLGVPTGSYALTFRYAVNPFASAKQYRSISWGDIEISKTFLDSLYGVTMAQFSERIIENFRSNRLEPKVRVKDIRILKQKAKTKAWRNNSPFQP